MKLCTRCKEVKSPDSFYSKESRCVPCVSLVRREKYRKNPQVVIQRVTKYRKNNPEKIRDTKLKQTYGVGIEYFNARLQEQNGVCAICKTNRKAVWRGKKVEMSLDHDHNTGEPRGVLCSKCNTAFGLLEENEQSIKNMLDYINKYKKLG